MTSETNFCHWKVVFSWEKSEEKGNNFLGSKRRILKFTYSSNLAKTESLLIFVEQKLSSGPMCVPLMSVDIGSFTARPTSYRKLSHFKSCWHEKSFVCWTWTNRNLLKYSGVPIGICHQVVGKACHVCIWCHHANRALGKGGMRLQLRSDPLLWSHGQKRVVKHEVSCLIIIHAKSKRYLRYISAIYFGFSAKF